MVAKKRSIFLGWTAVRRLNLLHLPSPASAKLGTLAAEPEALQAAKGCLNWSSCEETTAGEDTPVKLRGLAKGQQCNSQTV